MNGERGWPPPPKRSRHETQEEEKEQGDCEEIAVTQITSESKGRYLNDVRKIFGILDPLPPFVTHSRNLSVVFVTYWVTPPPPLSADVI